MHMIDDALLLDIVEDINNRLTRKQYEEMLIKSGRYSINKLHYDDEYSQLTKYDLIFKTLQISLQSNWDAPDYELLYEINRKHPFSIEVRLALEKMGIQLSSENKTSTDNEVVELKKTERSNEGPATSTEMNKAENSIAQVAPVTRSTQKNKYEITPAKATIVAAIIGVIGICLGAILTPVVEKLINQTTSTRRMTSLRLEENPFTVYPYDGEHDDDVDCCFGMADFEYVLDSNLEPGYALQYEIPAISEKFGYAGIAFVFEQSQNFSEYKKIEFSVAFTNEAEKFELNFEDIAGTKEPYLIVGKLDSENTYVVPLNNYKAVDFKAIRAISLQVDTQFIRGNGRIVVKDITFTK